MNNSKVCATCKELKSLDSFGKNKRFDDGLSYSCKSCKKIADAKYAAKNKEKLAKYHKEYIDKNRQQIYSKHNEWRMANPDKVKEYQKNWLSKNLNKKRAYNAQWAKDNKELMASMIADWAKRNPESGRKSAAKRRALLNASHHQPYTEKEIISLYGKDCHLCKLPIDFDASRRVGKDGWEYGLHIDHLIPIHLGGSDSLANVRPSHGLCNLRKGHR